MDNGADPTAITWQDDDDQTHTWPSLDAWVSDWWVAKRERDVVFRAEEAGATGVPWPESPACDFLDELVMDGDPRSVAFIEALAGAAETDQDFADLGAGDIESLLCHREDGARFIDDVETRARRTPAFARTLRWMWVGADVDAGLRRRLLALGAIDLTAG